ncbi:hypothetical protein DM39_5070 [Burkholderia cenocepacia]|uniref:Uncharacterized protein n=1 Tax=Burkholderia cenocepacia TaxID=95486 RepID=A0AAN0RYB2_9BURK|nr:hypothetical protein DM39_5070 [Burkholderia cenocepacia]
MRQRPESAARCAAGQGHAKRKRGGVLWGLGGGAERARGMTSRVWTRAATCPAPHVVCNTASRAIQIVLRGRCASSSKQHAGTSASMWPRLSAAYPIPLSKYRLNANCSPPCRTLSAKPDRSRAFRTRSPCAVDHLSAAMNADVMSPASAAEQRVEVERERRELSQSARCRRTGTIAREVGRAQARRSSDDRVASERYGWTMKRKRGRQ